MRMNLRALLLTLAVTGATLTGLPDRAEAGPGFRVGLTDDPDSIFLGFQYGIPLSRLGQSYLVARPGVDLAVVDGPVDFFLRGTFHFNFVFPLSGNLTIYPLVGPTLVYYNWDGGDDTEVGVDLGFGFGIDRFSFEVWAGLSDIPDITFAFGVAF